ncbi:pygopus homolog 1 isoform X1 [Danio rerio]|uniref:Pygopus homolog 1 isoform X1 n=2 Tax=Danio rerio TaxID=7955 RepID=A0AC58HUP6_DANRE
MSTEQEKESFSLKRNRGGEAGLDVLAGPGLLLGSPDKKRRKSSTQAPPFSPLSEYAPPPNPSADHLIAANPFDDNYVSPSLKPYFGHSHYPASNSYGSSRMPSPYGPTIQTQPQYFSQNPTGFSRTHRFNYSPNYVHAFCGGNNNNNNMHFGSVEHGDQIPLQNLNQRSPGFNPDANTTRNMSPNLNNFTQSNTKQDHSEAANKKHSHNVNCEENATQDNKTKGGPEKLNGVFHSNNEKKSPDYRRSALRMNKVKRRSTSSSSEPVFPCGICLNEVNDDQEAILCEASCQKWFHRVCTGMTETAYNLLTAETSAVWGCDTCMEDREVQMMKNSDGQS